LAAGTPIDITGAACRTLTGIPSGPVTLPTSFHGKSWLTATVAPDIADGVAGTINVTTNSVTCTAHDGSGSYTYAWVQLSGDAITADSPTSATTTFRGSAMSVSETRSAIFACNVTDTVSGSVVQSDPVSVSVERT
jgi:hypothetical protein